MNCEQQKVSENSRTISEVTTQVSGTASPAPQFNDQDVCADYVKEAKVKDCKAQRKKELFLNEKLKQASLDEAACELGHDEGVGGTRNTCFSKFHVH